ncbi:hypothetical protein HDU91_005378, partial [Kappamyces sp. JEL0680]
LAAVLDEFEFECSKLDACLMISHIAAANPDILKQCMAQLTYYSDKLILLEAIEKTPMHLRELLDEPLIK